MNVAKDGQRVGYIAECQVSIERFSTYLPMKLRMLTQRFQFGAEDERATRVIV